MKYTAWTKVSFSIFAPFSQNLDCFVYNNHETELHEDINPEGVVHQKQVKNRKTNELRMQHSFVYRETYFLDELFYTTDLSNL